MDKIKVAVRSRPNNDLEDNSCVKCINETTIIVEESRSEKKFNFDCVFDELSKQKEIYDEFISTLVQNFVKSEKNGQYSNIIACGQTCAGKSYTIGFESRERSQFSVPSENCGIIPRLLEDVFILKKNEYDLIEYDISFFEIYNDCVRDLLSTEKTKIQVQTDGNSVKLVNLSQHQVKNVQEALDYLETGLKSRTTGCTSLNTHSSRSHCFFSIYMTKQTENNIIESQFNIIDLAGSENPEKANTDGKSFKEGVNINKSLLYLGDMLNALHSRSLKTSGSSFISSRNSILTRILTDSLNGTSSTRIIACISPSFKNQKETIKTLQFASKAGNIRPKNIPASIGKENNSYRRVLDQNPKTPWRKDMYRFPLISPATPATVNSRAAYVASTGMRTLNAPPKPTFSVSPEVPKSFPPVENFLSSLAEKVQDILEKQFTDTLEQTFQNHFRKSSISLGQENTSRRSSLLELGQNLNDDYIDHRRKQSTPQDLQKFLSPLARKVHDLMEETISQKFEGMERSIAKQLSNPTKNLRRSTRISQVYKDLPMKAGSSTKQRRQTDIPLHHIEGVKNTSSSSYKRRRTDVTPLIFLDSPTATSEGVKNTSSSSYKPRRTDVTPLNFLDSPTATSECLKNTGRTTKKRRKTDVIPFNLSDSPTAVSTSIPVVLDKVSDVRDNSILVMPPPNTTVIPRGPRAIKGRRFESKETKSMSDEKGRKITPRKSTKTKSTRSDETTRMKNPGKDTDHYNKALNLHTEEILKVLNNGTLKELQALPTVGVKTANMFFTYRTLNGPFASIEDILNVELNPGFYKRFAKSNFIILNF